MSPYIGHREPNLTSLGVSPAGTPAAPADSTIAERITHLVGTVAKDDADRSMLLQALGVIPTQRDQLSAVAV